MIERLLEKGLFSVMKELSYDKVVELTETYGAHNYAPLPVVIEKCDGAIVWDINGKEYIDLIGCYSAISHGHRNREIIKTALQQLDKLIITGRPVYTSEMAVFVQTLSEYTGMDMVLPMNTGAEAVETALKCARRWGYKAKKIHKDKAEIIAAAGNFHGRTITIVGFSTEESYQDGFGPFTPGFKIIPYNDISALEAAINKNTVAFLVEPIQAEGGVIVPYEGYFKDVRKVCDKHNILFIADEVQTGFGRTGKDFAHQWEGIKPDMMTLGKALGGGVIPISALVGKKDILGYFTPGSHGSTFGGNAFACSIAIQSILEMIKEKLPERALRAGKMFMDGIKSFNSPHIKEVRGKGLLIGVEFKPESGSGHDFAAKLLSQGIITKDTHKQTIRITPPLTINDDQISKALKIMESVVK